VDVSGSYTEPNGSKADGWRTDVYYPTGVVLEPGESMTFHYVVSVSHRVFDGQTLSGTGTIIDLSCTVTGA
jgi:hypothetical protein